MTVKAEIKDVIRKIEDFRDTLQKQQDESEDKHADWENEESEDDEPDVIDNSEEITQLDRALNFLEKAVDELDD